MPSSTSSSEDTIFVADDISHQFGTVTVLDEISLSVKTGEFLALVGPNGSGKTTLLQIITGLLTPSEGTIARPSGSARPIGYLPQHPNLRASQTVRETLEFYGTLLADATDTGRILETIGLDAVSERRVGSLSGGMRQLLGLGVAVLGDPSLVVLDEPTSGLDPRNTEHIFDVVDTLTNTETSALMTTHDLTYVSAADEVGILNDGRLVVQASPTDLRNRTTETDMAGVFGSVLGRDPSVQTGHKD